MITRNAALGAVVLLVAGCGGRAVGTDAGPGSPAAEASTLTVHTHITEGRHGAVFIEGAVPEIRLIDEDGMTLAPEDDHTTTAAFPDLVAGTYRLHAALRPCDGNCGYLDGPTTPCEGEVRVPRVGSVDVTWRVGEACRLLMRP